MYQINIPYFLNLSIYIICQLCVNRAGGVERDALTIGSLQIFADAIFFSFAFLNCHTHDEQLTSNVQVLYISIPSKNKNIDGVQQKLNVPYIVY